MDGGGSDNIFMSISYYSRDLLHILLRHFGRLTELKESNKNNWQ